MEEKYSQKKPRLYKVRNTAGTTAGERKLGRDMLFSDDGHNP